MFGAGVVLFVAFFVGRFERLGCLGHRTFCYFSQNNAERLLLHERILRQCGGDLAGRYVLLCPRK